MALTKVTSSMTEGGDDLQTDIALLGFKVAANGSLAAYGLSKQAIDAFEDASGIDAGASTNEVRNASSYYSGKTITPSTQRTTFTASTTWTAPDGATSVEALVVGGGGGGGGGASSGGGGAGSLIYHSGYSVTPGNSYTVTIGTGGSAGSSGGPTGSQGGASVFGTISATGGGGGGCRSNTSSIYTGVAGGSGGGGGSTTGDGTQCNGGAANVGTTSGGTGYASAGGFGKHVGGSWEGGGGGGGAGAVGEDGSSTHPRGGDGGDGLAYTIADGSTSVYYAGGGGASGNTNGSGGSGGGGDSGVAGTANTGGGGGSGADGGSGVVIIYYSYNITSEDNMTLVSNASTADAAPDKADIVMTYTNGAGTATINTDLKAYVSRDGGTTWTQATLSADGTSGGHSILVAHNIDISSQPSGTSMKYKIETLNQSASKETRIQAVSLGWK